MTLELEEINSNQTFEQKIEISLKAFFALKIKILKVA